MLADHAVKGKEPEGDDRKARRHKGKKAGRPERPEGTKQEGTTGEKAELFISTYKEVKSAECHRSGDGTACASAGVCESLGRGDASPDAAVRVGRHDVCP
jgi:hypothetical protein